MKDVCFGNFRKINKLISLAKSNYERILYFSKTLKSHKYFDIVKNKSNRKVPSVSAQLSFITTKPTNTKFKANGKKKYLAHIVLIPYLMINFVFDHL